MSGFHLLATPAETRRRRRALSLPGWVEILAGGALLWGLAVVVLLTTGDPYVTGAVAMGTLVVPFALAARIAGAESVPGVDSRVVVRLFAAGGLLGFLGSAFLENPLSSRSAPVFAGWVGGIEEAAKLIVLALMTRGLAERTARTGFVLGGLVGFGFAAFESAGYALSSVMGSSNGSHSLIEMVLTRAAITPFTHGLWTAVVGAAFFASRRRGCFRLGPLALAAFIGAVGAHALWDLMPNLATDLSVGLAGRPTGRVASLSSNLFDAVGRAILSAPFLYVVYRLQRLGHAGRGRHPKSTVPTVAVRDGGIDRYAA